METFDVCVLLCTGLAAGFSLGFTVRSRRFRNLESELEWERRKYAKLLDTYVDLKYDLSTPVKKAGRPKGSKNKPKQDVKPVTRKYTRKSSK